MLGILLFIGMRYVAYAIGAGLYILWASVVIIEFRRKDVVPVPPIETMGHQRNSYSEPEEGEMTWGIFLSLAYIIIHGIGILWGLGWLFYYNW